VVVIVLCTCGTGVGMVVPNSLEAGEGICEDAYPFVSRERGKGRVYGYQFRVGRALALVCGLDYGGCVPRGSDYMCFNGGRIVSLMGSLPYRAGSRTWCFLRINRESGLVPY